MKNTKDLRQEARELMKSILRLHFEATNTRLTPDRRQELHIDLSYGIDEMRDLLIQLDRSAVMDEKS